MKAILAVLAAMGAAALVVIVVDAFVAATLEDEYDPYADPFGMPL